MLLGLPDFNVPRTVSANPAISPRISNKPAPLVEPDPVLPALSAEY